MDRVLSQKNIVARKTHLCDASYHWRESGYALVDCDTDDQRLIVEAAQACGWKILPGQLYLRVTVIHEGSICTYRARIGMDAVCRDLGLFDD